VTEDHPLEQELKQLIVERLFLKVAPEDIGDEDPLMDTYGVDSVQLFEIVVGLEEVYGITMEDEEFDLALFANVKSIADFVRRKQSGTDSSGETSAESGE
jgi:acyl carrier protein